MRPAHFMALVSCLWLGALSAQGVQPQGALPGGAGRARIPPTTGAYHNRAIDYIFTHASVDIGPVATLADFQTLTGVLRDFLASEGFDVSGFDAAAASTEATLQADQAFYTTGGQTYFGFPAQNEQGAIAYVFDRLVARGVLSTALRDELLVISGMAFDPTIPLSQVRAYVQNDFLGMPWIGSDLAAAGLFADVFTHSASYWNRSPAHSRLAPGDGVIVADAAGALYGLLCGPAWSIIEGALFSVIANNATIAQPVVASVPSLPTWGIVILCALVLALGSRQVQRLNRMEQPAGCY